MALQSLSDEHVLIVNDFRQPDVLTGHAALAAKLQNLLLMRKGSMPNDPNMGVDIGSYQFENSDDRTRLELDGEIERQVEAYLPDLPIRDVASLIEADPSDAKRIYVNFRLAPSVPGRQENVLLAFQRDRETGQVLFRVVI